MPSSYLQIFLQRQIASGTFPSNRDDWYMKQGLEGIEMSLEDRFTLFEQAQRKEDAPYYQIFYNIELNRYEVDVTLANQSKCITEVVSFYQKPSFTDKPASGHGKHIIYFTGMGTLYQGCFADITQAVRTTGARYYAFEYPGMKALGGEVLEVNDLVNTGMAVANDLLRKGISINDILFQGDSFGAAVAKKISDQFKQQSGVEIRCIMNNTFSTFQEAVQGVLLQSSWQMSLKFAVRPILRYAAWDIRPGDTYGNDTPYQVHVNHIGDLLLGAGHATLAELVESNSQLQNFIDPCPEEYVAQRDSYNNLHWVTLSPEGEQYLAAKYGRNSAGQVDTHLADLYYLMYPDGSNVYETLICKYLEDSNAYLAKHPQTLALDQLPHPLGSETVSLYELLTPLLPTRTSIFSFFRSPTVTTINEEIDHQPQSSISTLQ